MSCMLTSKLGFKCFMEFLSDLSFINDKNMKNINNILEWMLLNL